MPVFMPPVVYDVSRFLPDSTPIQKRIMRHYSPLPRGRSVVLVNGTYVTMDNPSQDLLDGLEEGVGFFLGGHMYVVTDAVAADLVSDGYGEEGEAGGEVTYPGSWASYSSTPWGLLAPDFWAGPEG